MNEAHQRSQRPTDDRLVDPDMEGLIEDEDTDAADIPDDERVVAEDLNEYVPDEDNDQPGG